MNQVVFKGHPAWQSPTMLRFIFASVFACLALGTIVTFAVGQDLIPVGQGALILMAISSLSFGATALFRLKTTYLITNRGVRYEAGFPVKTTQREFSYQKIQAVDVHQSLIEKLLLKTGTVTISSAASDANQDDIVFEGVRRPGQLAQSIRDGEDRVYGGGGFQQHPGASYQQPARYEDNHYRTEDPYDRPASRPAWERERDEQQGVSPYDRPARPPRYSPHDGLPPR